MKTWITILVLIMASMNAMAETSEQKLSALIGNVQTFNAQFQQTVHGGTAKKPQEVFGEFQLQKPGKFRWETKKPYRQILVGTGKELWVYEPDIGSATVNDVEAGLGSTPALLLASSASELAASFTIAETATNQFQLMPKDNGSNFEEILLVFNGKNINELLLSDTLGGKTRVLFTQVKVNEKLPVERFVFTPPADADLIDNRVKKNP